jgi:DNA polymerase-3 subunit epsilon
MKDLSGATILELAEANPTDILSDLQKAARRVHTWPFSLAAFLVIGLALAPFGLLLWAVGIPATWWLWMWDKARRSVVIFYDVEDESAKPFAQLVAAHESLSQALRAWNIEAQGDLHTWHQQKVNAGASAIVTRSGASLSSRGPSVLVTNIAIPSLNSTRRSIYFLPDRILVREGRRFADVSYTSLSVDFGPQRFVEDGPVPGDAERVGTTWRFVNKDGGPDRRFNNNRPLPILRYGRLVLQSSDRFLSVWDFTRPDLAQSFAHAIGTLTRLARRPQPRPPSVPQQSRTTSPPTVLTAVGQVPVTGVPVAPAGTPRTIVSKFYGDPCPVCHERLRNGEIITQLDERGWGHTRCVQQYHRDHANSEVADAIAAEAERVERAHEVKVRTATRMGRDNNPRLHNPASQIIADLGTPGACGLCGVPYQGGDVITQAISRSWAHSACAAREYEQYGRHDVAEMVRADERAINHPPTILAEFSSNCSLCNRSIRPGAAITFYIYWQTWVHAGCLWRRYEKWGKSEIAELIRADATQLQTAAK